jgi:oxygen-independent coproporphyrinogen-3 oxidase
MESLSTVHVSEILRAKALAADALVDLVRPRLGQTRDRSLLIYLHVPFCSSKCTFCNWVSDVPVSQLRAAASVRRDYALALRTQISTLGPLLRELEYEPTHIYWGGGTPSMLSSEEFEIVIDALATSFDLSRIEEHAIETSPETLTLEKLSTMRRLGIDRISMGVQSFDNQELRRAGRAHSAETAVDAVRLMRDAGFGNINLDLIAGFPEQTPEVLERTLEKTIELDPEHVTVYVYRAEANTVMANQIHKGSRGTRTLDENLESYTCAQRALERAGYVEYTVGYFSRNDRYRFGGEDYYFGLVGDYIGLGSGAESIIGHHSLANRPGRLQQFLAHPTEFSAVTQFSPKQLDPVLRALRLTILTERGVDYRRFERLFGFPFAAVRSDPYISGLLQYLRYCGAEFVEEDDRLFVTERTRSRSYIVALQRKFFPMKAETKAGGVANAPARGPTATPVRL